MMSEAQKSREAGFRRIPGLSLLFILLCFLCSANANKVSLETVKKSHQIATERLKTLKAWYQEIMAAYEEVMAFYQTFWDEVMWMEGDEFADSPSYDWYQKNTEQIKFLDKYTKNIRIGMNAQEKKLKEQDIIIKCLESHRHDEL